MPYLAALTPKGYDVTIVDDSVREVPVSDAFDLAVFSGMLCNVPRAMDIAREFRNIGVKTVAGGIGVFSLGKQMEESAAFDSVVSGEAEMIWEQVLGDFRRGKLKPKYDGGRTADLASLPVARYDLMDLSRYWRIPFEPRPFLTVETSRGCPFDCRFCGVSLFFGREMRFRPVGDVVDEIKRIGAKWLVITDDNAGANPERASELFKALKPLDIKWAAQFSMDAVHHPEMLKLAGDAGCRHAVVGVESLNNDNLETMRKTQNLKVDINDAVRAFHDAGIAFTASMIFGMDHDTPESIDDSVKRLLESGADFCLPWVLTLGPGSRIFDEYKSEGRLLHENYSLYNGTEVCFRPKLMTSEQLEESARRAMRAFYRLPRCLSRGWRARKYSAEVGALSMYFWYCAGRGRHPFTGAI